MPNRILKDSILTSRDIDSLCPEEEVFWYRLLVSCDDFGRFHADPPLLRGSLFPRRLSTVTDQDIAIWLAKLADVGMVRLYEVDGNRFLEVPKWGRHQQKRAQHSKFPAPKEGHLIAVASNGYQPQANVPEKREARSETTRSERTTLLTPAERAGTFAAFWEVYPRKVGKRRAESAHRSALGRAEAGVIHEGATRLAEDPNLPESQFIPHPTTWLNRDGWLDEPLPPRSDMGLTDRLMASAVQLAKEGR